MIANRARVMRYFVCFAAIVCFATPLGSGQKVALGATETVRPKDRFQLSATVIDKSGAKRSVRLAARQWDVLGNQRISQFPQQGFLLVQLVGGRVSTAIEGKEEKRHHGEFWSVPANIAMSLAAVGEDATLEVMSISVQ